ncbi:MAG: hypothetical protein HDT38_03770 [Clostridiales bacterium]|nr:hypothetical protein [Clostridiales bacterium]
MKQVLTVGLLAFMLLLIFPGCEQGSEEERRLSRISEALGVDLLAGTLERYEDTHGGFHGDGLTSAVVELDGLEGDVGAVPGWKPLPLSENAAQAVRLCGGEGSSVEQGFYYLYDRHSESRDPHDDAELHSRYSWNFTVAVYDAEAGRIYYYEFDT